MARHPRNAYDGAYYHILQRGNNKQTLFKDSDDILKFRQLIKRYKHIYSFELYNYCIMSNHIHLLIRIFSKEHLSKIFQGIFQVFQLHHRNKYDYTGRLYQNRFKSLLIDTDAYLLTCARYIERNPLRAKSVISLGEHKWSSYHFYALGKEDLLLTPNPLYLELAKTPNKRKKLYIDYLLTHSPYEQVIDEKIEKVMVV